MNRTLWILQALVAVVFAFAGVMKFIMPVEEMTKDMPSMPGAFLHFIGATEILGALGLILPGLLKIRPGLTPLSACGLTLIMAGAVATTLATATVGMSLFPLVVGLLSAFIAYGRWRLAPLPSHN